MDVAARFYSFTAPATSAHLMLQRNLEVASDPKSSRKGKSGGSCEGCGTILVPGWTSRTSITSKTAPERPTSTDKAKKRRRRPVGGLNKTVRIDCLICHRFGEVTLPPLSRSKAIGDTMAKSQTIPSMTANTTAASPVPKESPKLATSNASSKQRAKARKQGGLQAMLAKSKSSASPASGFGLDLSDLMKQG